MCEAVISIVICTCNRSSLLTNCLNSLLEQDIENELFEIIVIDNKSTDDTSDVAMKFAEEYKNVRALCEENQGIGYARNKGWQEARGKYVAYIDDDARAHKDWISEMYNFIMRQPDIQAFGGPYFPFSLVKLPDWMPPEYGKNYLGDIERPVVFGQEWISGTNMVFTKNILCKYGGFKNDIGVIGKKILYGEEVELFSRIGKDKELIYYVPRMKVDHLVAPYKMNITWFLKSAYAMGRSKARRHNVLLPFYIVLARLIKRIMRSPIAIFSNKKRNLKGRLVDALVPIASGFGMVIERVMIGFGIEHLK